MSCAAAAAADHSCHNEDHDVRQEPQQAAGPKVPQAPRPLFPVQPEPAVFETVSRVWTVGDGDGVVRLFEKGDTGEAVQHHEGDQPAAREPPSDAFYPHFTGCIHVEIFLWANFFALCFRQSEFLERWIVRLCYSLFEPSITFGGFFYSVNMNRLHFDFLQFPGLVRSELQGHLRI